ncbi:hypothetical protein BGX26_006565 [Mortierella sp. AD094]|nr:hypothetical protein BGX26_006565 [Mortierella sp. AD094]
MSSNDNSYSAHGAREFREPDSTLDLHVGRNLQTGAGSTKDNISGNDSRTRSKLLIDSDDDMDDDDDDDDELLMMPVSSQKMELQIDQTFSAPFSSREELSQPSLDAGSETAPVLQLPDTSATYQQEAQRQHELAPDEDSLFGEDFMAQFGDDGELELEATENRRPLFPRRITLLEATNDDHESGENEDLGLDRLSISQRHRTKSGAPAVTKTTTSTHTATSSTTIISALPSRFNMFNRPSMGSVPPMSQESSQFEEELLEMSARQHDAMLDDLILEDELLRNEEEDLDDLLQMQYQEQELQQQKQQRGQPQLDLNGINETNKRKHPVAAAASSTSTLTTSDDIDRFLEQSYAVNDNLLQRSIEKSKRSRLEHASTGSLNSRGASLPVTPSLQGLSIRPRLPEAPKYDYTLPPVTGSFIKAKSLSGQTFYLAKKVRVDNTKHSFVQQLKENSQNKKSLLSIPIHRMMDELDAEIRVQKQEAINRLEYGDSDEPELADDVPKGLSERLWVDKYRPKKYTDLMGDERVNREVLSWIKEWDQCVFGRKYKKFTSEYKQQQQQFKEFRKQDPLGRPDRKVLLLTGPPGLGKTTMAHVIAKQAGYNVIEVNASDDRTGASVKGKIEAALEIQSILGSDKPNLLIIDEIDGVSSSGGEQSFIKLLVDMATVEAASKEEKSKSAGKKSKKYIKKPLMRPIICICNDQYAPVLRPLRVIAQIYQFKKPSIRSVVTRLQQICEIEQIRSDTRAFGALYEMTEGDMRSCLNTLQFIKNKSKTGALSATSTSTDRIGGERGDSHGQGLTLETLNRATIGHKDQNKSLFSVWEELFQAPYARKTRSALKVMEEGRDNDSKTYISRMVSMIQTNGDYDKLIQGCFENFPTMIFHDVAMSKVVECTDWLAFYDQLNSKITSNFEYEVGGYIAYALVNFHRFFAGSVRQKIEYPRKDYESFVAHKAHESILQGMTLNLPAKAQRHFRKSNFATELLSPFLRILSPYLRPVNKQLIKPDERLVLQRLVDIMIHFQLTFVQEKTEDGQFLYRLEPSIEKLGDFSGIGLKNVLTNRYAVRQLIAQEIEVELVRRSEAVKEAKVGMFFGKGAESKDPTNSLGASLDTAGSLSMSKNMEQDDFEREAVDFFGRAIVQTKEGLTERSLDGSFMMDSEERQMKKKKTRIWYKFNEGFSNAVKAKVFISELL